jgi:hypothetical protein
MLAAVLLGPVAANASTKRTARVADFEVPASNGYDAYIFAIHQTHPNRHAHVYLALENGDSQASYRARALFTNRHLNASLGPFGRINLRIRHDHRAALTAAHALHIPTHSGDQTTSAAKATNRVRFCLLSVSDSQNSRFRGRIRFEGEQGYSSIHANRAYGSVDSGKISCSSGGKRVHGTFLTAEAGQVTFGASHYDRWPKRSFLYASQSETVGRVTVERSAASHRGAVFDFSPDFLTAHVEPSAGPLSGTADFAAPDQWTGDLTASFPGEPDVPLTGPEFTARLKHF